MLKEGVRILGIACVMAGIFLFFYTAPVDDTTAQAENTNLTNQVAQLQTKLDQTEKELAKLQTLSSEATDTSEPDEEKDETPAGDSPAEETPNQTMTLHIESGTTSKDVATQLEDAHIIEDASTFNDYLKKQQLTKKIQIGEYTIDASMSIEEISTLITRLPGEV